MFNPNENPILPNGNNAESINNPKGENTMDTSNQDTSKFEAEVIEGLEKLEMSSGDQTSATPPDSGEILAGDYLVRITDVHQKKHSSGVYFMIIVNMVVDNGEYEDFPLTKFYHLKSQKALDFFKKEMKLIGHSVTSEYDLPVLLNNLPETYVIATVVFNESGNRIIYLKSASTPKKVVNAAPKLKW